MLTLIPALKKQERSEIYELPQFQAHDPRKRDKHKGFVAKQKIDSIFKKIQVPHLMLFLGRSNVVQMSHLSRSNVTFKSFECHIWVVSHVKRPEIDLKST